METERPGFKLRKDEDKGEIWKVRDLKNQPMDKAREIQGIQNEQVYLKMLEKEENRKAAQSRGAVAVQKMRMQQMVKEEPNRKLQDARIQASLTEKERARRVAMRTPPPQELPLLPEKRDVADFYDTNYLNTWSKDSTAYQATKSSNQGNAVLGAIVHLEQRELDCASHIQEQKKRDELATKRYHIAKEKEMVTKRYGSVLTDLETAHREDIARKQKSLVMKPVKKRNAAPYVHPLQHTDRQKMLERDVKTLFYPGPYDKRSDPFYKMRLQRQQCMRKWRTGTDEIEINRNQHETNVTEIPESLDLNESSSPDLLNQAVHEHYFQDTEPFRFDQTDQPILQNSTEVAEKTLVQTEEEGLCDKQKAANKSAEKRLADATTQTITLTDDFSTYSLPPSQEAECETEKDEKEGPSVGNESTGSGDLKLGSVVTVPAIPEKVPSKISEVIERAASKTFGLRYFPSVFPVNNDTDKENTPTSAKVGITVKPKLFQDSFLNVQPLKIKVFPVPSTNQPVKLTRKVTKVTSEDFRKDFGSDQLTSTTKTKNFFSPVFLESADKTPTMDTKLVQNIKTSPEPDTKSGTESQSTRALSSIESQMNIMKIDSSRSTIPEEETDNTHSSNKNYTSSCEYTKENVDSTLAHKSSHSSYFCEPRFFSSVTDYNVNSPCSEEKVQQETAVLNLNRDTQKEVIMSSESSLESVSPSPSSPNVSLPNYLRHSLETKLREKEQPVTAENIQLMLEQFAAFESFESYIRPPPPVSFPVGIQGTEDVVPHELSTIVEVDTPQNSLLGSRGRSFGDAKTANSVFSSQKSPEEHTPQTPQTPVVGTRVPAIISPCMSLPSSLSSWSTILKAYSPSASTTSSQLSEAFSAGKIKMHSTPVKVKKVAANETASESNLIDQTLTLVDGFSVDVDSNLEADACLTMPSLSKHLNFTNPTFATSTPSSYSSFRSLSPVTSSILGRAQTVPSSISLAESESLLSFLRHEESIQKSNDVSCSFLK